MGRGAGTYLQINHYRPSSSPRAEMLERHEDGHLITLAHSNQPGLEIEVDGVSRPAPTGPREFIVMPGELLTLMSGGEIPPLYHAVRRDVATADRLSLMLFANPDPSDRLDCWVQNATNRGIDVIERARSNPSRFGLSRW